MMLLILRGCSWQGICWVIVALIILDVTPFHAPTTARTQTPYKTKPATTKVSDGLDKLVLQPSKHSKSPYVLNVQSNSSVSVSKLQAIEFYERQPIQFEPNRGQFSSEVQYLSRSFNGAFYLTSTESVMVFKAPRADRDFEVAKLKTSGASSADVGLANEAKSVFLRMRLEGSNKNAQGFGIGKLTGKSNYLIGNDPANWQAAIPHYAKVRYENVYPGIDLLYYGNGKQLEYDFVVAAGADPKNICLSFYGADTLHINDRGDLVLSTFLGDILLRRPHMFQEIDGERKDIQGRYVLENVRDDEHFPRSSKDRWKVSFEVDNHDTAKPLVIDPIIVYSTYFGSAETQFASAVVSSVAVDSGGNAYITGYTASDQFPTTEGALMNSRGADGCPLPPCADAFVSKFNARGQLVYSTYLGGNSEDSGDAIAVSSDGNVYVTGRTVSSDFPVSANAFQAGPGGLSDLFVAKLNAEGSGLIYSTYLGGNGNESANGIAIDAAGNAYITGSTGNFLSSDFPPPIYFPVTPGAFQSQCPRIIPGIECSGLFVTKLNATGTALIYATYFGGSSGLDRVFGIAVDGNGYAHIFGTTTSRDLPTVNAFQSACQYCDVYGDGFITKFNQTGSNLVYSTYLGGSYGDASYGGGIAVDASGNAYVTGWTESPDFPTTEGAFKLICEGAFVVGTCSDVFVSKFGPAGNMVYSTILGQGYSVGIAVDKLGNAYVTGTTSSATFPLANALQADCLTETLGGYCWDIFITKLNAAGSGLVYSTYLGGRSVDQAKAIAIDSFGNAIVTGTTVSHDFPLVNPVQNNCDTCPPAKTFVTKLSPLSEPSTNVFCPAESLQSALDTAFPGEVILVSGICQETVLIASSKQRITLDGGGMATLKGMISGRPTLNVKGKGILVRGFIITGGSEGVEVNRGSNAVINNNVIESTTGNGILVNQLSFSVITNNTIQSNPGAGIFVDEHSTARIGFNLDTETTASPNTIQNNSLGVVVSDGSSARIVGNWIANNSGDGVFVARDSHADVASNSIDDNGGGGIEVRDDSAVQLGEDSGTSIYESPNATTTSNTGFGIHCSSGSVADGRRGSLTGTGGAINFDSSCVNGLTP